MRRRSSSVFTVIGSFLILASGTFAASTTIEFWQFWTDSKIKPVMQDIVNDFEKLNPKIKVNLTDLTWSNGHEKIVIAFASKNAPDIVELGSDWLAQFADAGQLSDLTSETQEYEEEFYGWSMATYDSKVYGWPWILGTRVMFFNRDLLSKAGYDSSFIPIKLSEFKQNLFNHVFNYAFNHNPIRFYRGMAGVQNLPVEDLKMLIRRKVFISLCGFA